MIEHHNHYIPRDSFYLPEAIWLRGRNVLAALLLVGWAASLAAAALDTQRFLASYLVAFFYATTIVLGGALFTMIQHLTGSAWSVPVRRGMEGIMRLLPVCGLLFLPVAFGVHELYEWAHPEFVAKALPQKRQVYDAYLNTGGFYLRAVIYFALWTFWSWRLYSWSRQQDATGDVRNTFRCERFSAPGMVLFFLSASLASVDWVMSLNPHWYSTMFGVYCLSGGAWGFFAVLTFVFLRLRSNGVLQHSVTVEHYHDLGKWMFALTIFWAYIAFSQYMLIWYANLPEETIFFRVRRSGSWEYVSGILLFGHFILPFLVLLARNSKRSFNVLKFSCLWIMAMHYTDIYWLIKPNFDVAGVAPSWMDLATLVAVGATLGIFFWMPLRHSPIVPIGDPRLRKGLEFQNV